MKYTTITDVLRVVSERCGCEGPGRTDEEIRERFNELVGARGWTVNDQDAIEAAVNAMFYDNWIYGQD